MALSQVDPLFIFVWIVMIVDSTVIRIAICVGVFFDCIAIINIA